MSRIKKLNDDDFKANQVSQRKNIVSFHLKHNLFYGSFGAGISLMTKNAIGVRFDYAWHPHSSKGRGEVDVGLKF